MWFKQISFYPLNTAKLPELDTLADKLAAAEFAPCMGLDWFSEGFAAPVAFSPELVFPADYTWRVALKKEEKVLPAGVIRDILDERVVEIQNAEARNVGRKEKQELKEQITDDLLPRAFTRSSRSQAIFDTKHGYLADPIYGGNKGMKAWIAIGFPGARASFTEWVKQHNVPYPLGPVSLQGARA